MSNAIPTISLGNLALAFLPVLGLLAVFRMWSLGVGTEIYAVARMLLQLVAVGYVLAYVFGADQAWIVLLVLSVMLAAAGWISLRPVAGRRRDLLAKALVAIGASGLLTLALVTQAVLELSPWYMPRYVVPLAGMIFANAMNAVSLAAERFHTDQSAGASYEEARQTALKTSLIPLTNSLFAVGLVAIPGMMTGQILAGASPLIAARYQIVVMCMVFGSGGLAAAGFLALLRPGNSLVAASAADKIEHGAR